MRDFAVKELDKEAKLVLDHDEDEIFTTIKIFGWNLFRVFRDSKGEMICIVLEKDGLFKEFVSRPEAKKRYGNESNS